MQIVWLLDNLISAALGVILTLAAGYLIYKFRQRTAVSVEIAAASMAPLEEIAIVVTNHGRVPTVVAELSVYLPAAQILPDWPAPLPPDVVIPRFHKMRRAFRTFGSKNDLHAMQARVILSDGAVKAEMIDQTETVTVMPKEKVARRFRRHDPRLLVLQTELPGRLTLVPTCRVSGHQHKLWGPPVFLSLATIGDKPTPLAAISLPTLHEN